MSEDLCLILADALGGLLVEHPLSDLSSTDRAGPVRLLVTSSRREYSEAQITDYLK